jgi:hypothetical protein
MPRRWLAPQRDGELLADPGFDAVAALVEANRQRLDSSDVRIGELPLREIRSLARTELAIPPGLLLVGGHQPELSHPGVWTKNFALNGLARRLGGTPLHLIVDNDTLKSTALRFPVFRNGDPESVHLQTVPFDKLDGETYEHRAIFDPELFRTFAARAAPLMQNWGFEPALPAAWEYVTRFGELQTNLGSLFTALRRRYEHGWGCRNVEVEVSRLSRTESFAHFAGHILADLPRFREVYNASIRSYRVANGIRSANHPAPELEPHEAPFWVQKQLIRRERGSAGSDIRNLRPRALTLTLFARLCLGDWFIHGIGGGKYDEVTDAIIRDYFGIEPPEYQVVSATLHLPLPGFASTEADVAEARRLVRDLRWNPQRHLRAESLEDHLLMRQLADRIALAANEPPFSDRTGRRRWYEHLRDATERLWSAVADQLPEAQARLARVEAEARANAVLRRRDFSWVLFPEELLKRFLQKTAADASGS